jgi:hypothetical protein
MTGPNSAAAGHASIASSFTERLRACEKPVEISTPVQPTVGNDRAHPPRVGDVGEGICVGEHEIRELAERLQMPE